LKNLSERVDLAVILCVLLAISSITYAEEKGVQDNFFQVLDWKGYDQNIVLEDGTSLYSYVAESSRGTQGDSDRAEHNSIMRLTFFPRFKCSPLIELVSVLPDNLTGDQRIATLKNFNNVSLTIDDEPLEYPTLVEEKNNSVKSFLNASLKRRTTVRILVELGDASEVTFGDGTKTTFSLIGSRDSINQAMGRCKNHQ